MSIEESLGSGIKLEKGTSEVESQHCVGLDFVILNHLHFKGFPGGSAIKNLPAFLMPMQEMQV